LVLGIVASVADAVVAGTWVMADYGAAAPGADLGEPRIFFDLDAPALVFGEMPVEVVHLMQRDEVDIAFYEIHRVEMAADVEMQTAVFETGIVVDGDGGDLQRAVGRADVWSVGCRLERAQRQQLDQRLDAVEGAGMGRADDGDAVRRGVEMIMTVPAAGLGA